MKMNNLDRLIDEVERIGRMSGSYQMCKDCHTKFYNEPLNGKTRLTEKWRINGMKCEHLDKNWRE